jgi:hypothetical protein
LAGDSGAATAPEPTSTTCSTSGARRRPQSAQSRPDTTYWIAHASHDDTTEGRSEYLSLKEAPHARQYFLPSWKMIPHALQIMDGIDDYHHWTVELFSVGTLMLRCIV